MTVPELIINTIKNFLETSSPKEIIITILAVIALIRIIVKQIQKTRTKKRPHTKKFKPKKWRSDGYYWDEKKKEWIAPDYTDKTPNSN